MPNSPKSIRRMMSRSSKARSRTYAVAALALAATAAGCKKDSLLQVTDPDILSPAAFETPAGAIPLRIGVIADFVTAFDGGTDSFVTITGNLADELLASDTFDGRLTINARKSVEINTEMEAVYRVMQRTRTGAARAASILATTAPTPLSNRGEVYMVLAYSELFFGEAWCSGVPFSSEVGGETVFGKPLKTDEMFQLAVIHFDSALAFAETNTRVLNGSKLGKGRALMNLGKFTEAAAAVVGVPTSFILNTSHSANSSANGAWSASTSGASRYRLMSNEGKNGLPFLGQTAAQDPRIPWSTSTRAGFSSQFTAQPNQSKYVQYGDGVVTTGVEARFIELESQLQAGTQAARDAVYAGVNSLRTGGAPIGGGLVGATPGNVTVAALTTGAPTTQAAAIDLLYKERAYWLWLTGHRLGDLRRLVRVYKRDTEAVFPTGALTPPLDGTYGTGTTLTVPFSERNNPNFQGCLDEK
jgi:starch-binding outer membrane protein, SusD/RagB family